MDTRGAFDRFAADVCTRYARGEDAELFARVMTERAERHRESFERFAGRAADPCYRYVLADILNDARGDMLRSIGVFD